MQQSAKSAATIVAGIVLTIATSAAAPARAQDRNFRAEQIDRQTQTLPLGATGSLELRNIVGDISVTAGSGRDVTVEIVRRSRGRTDADAKLGLERVRVEVDRRGERATVVAVYPSETGRQPYGVSVSYTVTAPPGTRVSVSSLSGDVIIKDIKGDLSAAVTSGDITVSGASQVSGLRTISGDITLSDVSSDGGVTAGTMSGDVLIQRVKARRISADVTSGSVIARDVTAGSAQLKSLSGDVEYAGSLVRGGRYELQSHSGTVRLVFAGEIGFELQANTFNGSISMPQTGIDFRNVSTARRRLRGTVGDGSAVVAMTTFNGDIQISRK